MEQKQARLILQYQAEQRSKHFFGFDLEPKKAKSGVWSLPCLRCGREVQVLPNGDVTGSAGGICS